MADRRTISNPVQFLHKKTMDEGIANRSRTIPDRRTISEELEKYGYVFSMKKSILLYLGTMLVMIALGQYFKLQFIPQIIVILFTALLLPLFMKNSLRNRYNQRRFSDLNLYMEQFLYSFQKSGKILTTLEEVADLFPQGEFHDTILEAIQVITNTYDEKNVEAKGLRIIESAYPNGTLSNIHRLALNVEEDGGEYQTSIRLLLEARQMWADRNYALLKEKRHQRNRVMLSILTTLFLCAMIGYMGERLDMAVSGNIVSQVMTVIVLCVDLFIFYRADKKFAQDDAIEERDAIKDILESKENLKKYNPKNPLDRMGIRIARKRVTRQMEKDFPKWLMQVSLLLQTENVHMAIYRSYSHAPLILKGDIKKLLEYLDQDPVSIQPYLNFLSDYTLPEVHSTMKMLYSLSEGKGAEASVQIAEVIKRNHEIMDRSAKLSNEDAMAGMQVLFLAPQITGGLKMLVDMVLLFTVYMVQLGNGV